MALMLVTLGVLVFLLIHLVPMTPDWRSALVARLGEGPYKGIFTLLALTGFVGALWAYRYTPHVPLWDGPPALRALTSLLMLAAVLCFALAKAPWGKRIVRHPMLWGIGIWGIAHLLSNGDLAGMVLFGGMAVFGFLWQFLTDRRDAEVDPEGFEEIRRSTSLVPFLRWNVRSDPITMGPLAIGAVVYLALILAHPWLFGAPVMV
ncbi:MAG: NnrU family protein [Pseudomonadota bacterium]